jgi:ribonuclease P/MRP protein subunit POP5
MVRVKRRYFVFQFHFNSDSTNLIKSSHIHTTFESMIARLYGDVGVARFTRNLSIIYFNPSTHVSIVRCLRDDKHMLQTAATFISKIIPDQIECSIQTIHVGGSIRQCKKYLVNYCIEQLLSMNFQSNNQNKTTSQMLFRNKKKKGNNQQQLVNIDQEKQLALQKLLADSRIESNSIIVSKSNDDDLGKRKRDDE